MFVTISELRMDDTVIPNGDTKIYTVTDLHYDSGKIVAVTLWDKWKETTNRASIFQLISRYWD